MTASVEREAPLGGAAPLIDVHAHFYYPGCGRPNWESLNAARMRAGTRIGVTYHVGSVLGSWGATSPTYFQSPRDTVAGNDAMLAAQQASPETIRCYAAVNPNEPALAVGELARCLEAGAVGVKLAAARRARDPVLDPVLAFADAHALPVLHHVWQHRRGEVPGQDISDGADLAVLAGRFPRVALILAHIGGGGDWAHTFAAVREVPNVYLDLSGSGVDRGMLDGALEAVGPRRLVWGADLTLETGLAKLWALEVIGLSREELADIRWRNAVRIFPEGSFPRLPVDTPA
ncbi:MAG TPA: amidohydrolase family protein [Gemmatimonadaceae bacterium]|nr:amidohydrolase family protein [Gemmatimonadaceae bacterium]